MLYNPTFLYTFVFSISWLLKPAMYAYKYRLAFLSETNRWLSINYQTKKVCLVRDFLFFISSLSLPYFCHNERLNIVTPSYWYSVTIPTGY